MEPEGISPREIIRVVPRINDSSLEPKGSGDFFVFVFRRYSVVNDYKFCEKIQAFHETFREGQDV